MRAVQALILAAGLVGAAYIVASYNRFSMTVPVAHGGDLIAYRLDRLTGKVVYCAVAEKSPPRPLCSPITGPSL